MLDTCFNTIIMSSLPESYRPALQTITASEQASKLSGMQLRAMKADNLITFITEEAQHCVINNDCTKSAESALAARTKNNERSKGKKKIISESCGRSGHGKTDCYQKGGNKEGQCYNFELLSDSSLYSCSVLSKLSIVYSCFTRF